MCQASRKSCSLGFQVPGFTGELVCQGNKFGLIPWAPWFQEVVVSLGLLVSGKPRRKKFVGDQGDLGALVLVRPGSLELPGGFGGQVMKVLVVPRAPWFRGSQENEGSKLPSAACVGWFVADIGKLAALKSSELEELVTGYPGKLKTRKQGNGEPGDMGFEVCRKQGSEAPG